MPGAGDTRSWMKLTLERLCGMVWVPMLSAMMSSHASVAARTIRQETVLLTAERRGNTTEFEAIWVVTALFGFDASAILTATLKGHHTNKLAELLM